MIHHCDDPDFLVKFSRGGVSKMVVCREFKSVNVFSGLVCSVLLVYDFLFLFSDFGLTIVQGIHATQKDGVFTVLSESEIS